MKTKKFISTITTFLFLTGALSNPVSSNGILHEENYTEPFAYLLEKMQSDEDGYCYTDGSGDVYYLNAETIEWYVLTKIQYEIYLDQDAAFSETDIKTLGEAFQKPVVISTEGTGNTQGVALQKNEDGCYILSWAPSTNSINDDTLITILNQMPSFSSVKKNVVGYNKREVYANYVIPYNTSLFIEVTEGEELTLSDLPEDIFVTELESVTGIDLKTYYYIHLDTDKYGEKIEPSVIYPIVKELAALEKIERIELSDWLVAEVYRDPTPYLIDNGAYTLLTRGDCDCDGSITMQDAYQALLCNSAASMGETPALSDRGQQAADIDGDGVVSASDAYHILVHTSYEALGKDPSWTEILNS